MIKAKTSFANAARGARLAFWLILVMMAYGLYKAYSAGQTVRAIAQEQTARLIVDEDRAFCEKFGLHAGGGDYAMCCRELAIIRQKQTDRDRAAGQGLL